MVAADDSDSPPSRDFSLMKSVSPALWHQMLDFTVRTQSIEEPLFLGDICLFVNFFTREAPEGL